MGLEYGGLGRSGVVHISALNVRCIICSQDIGCTSASLDPCTISLSSDLVSGEDILTWRRCSSSVD